MNGTINTYWIQDAHERTYWTQFSESTVLALHALGVVEFVETERKSVDSLNIAAHRYRKAS